MTWDSLGHCLDDVASQPLAKSLLAWGRGDQESLDTVQALFSNSYNAGVLSTVKHSTGRAALKKVNSIPAILTTDAMTLIDRVPHAYKCIDKCIDALYMIRKHVIACTMHKCT